jgi:hypothetical protein
LSRVPSSREARPSRRHGCRLKAGMTVGRIVSAVLQR